MITMIRSMITGIGWYLFSLAYSSVSAQTPSQWLANWTATSAPEKIYIQTDKPYYAIGDTIWLSAFAVDGITHLTGGTSRVAYLQLLNSTGELIAQRVLQLTSGRGQADVALPDSLPEGDYQLVAFTNWMRNSPDAYFFRQTIHLWRTTPAAQKQPAILQSPDLQFFPEGGQLVVGIPCRVAFKALNSRGQSVEVQGTIVDNTGQEVTMPFRTRHNGMGLFVLTPQADKQYTAKLPDGTTYPLPVVQAQGIGFWVENLPTQRLVRITVYNPAAHSGELWLLAHLRGRVCFEAIVPNSPRAAALIPYDKIPADGILTLTLFDNWQPRCERLVLINRQRQLRITTRFDKGQYGPHEPVTVNFTVTDSTGKPVEADLALSITDAEKVVFSEPYADHLLSNLLLTSDLWGFVEQPAYYFDPKNPDAAPDADLLLMTQGWRRFLWQQPDPKPAFRREDGLTLTGRVLSLSNKPLPTGQVTMILSSGAQSRFADVAVDSAGRFAIENVDLVGPVTVVAKGMNQSGRQLRRVVLNPVLPVRAVYQMPPASDSLPVPTLFLQAEQARARVATAFRFTSGRTLRGVEVKATREQPFWRDYRRAKLGEPDAVVKQGNLPATTFLDMLRQSKAGSRVYNRIMTGSAPVYIYVDGVTLNENIPYTYVSDPVLTTGIQAAQIEQIDVISNPAKMGVLGGTGGGLIASATQPMVINILTKQGNYRNDAAPTGLTVQQTMGYSPVREFYVPKYAPNTLAGAGQPDSRPTLFWAPHLTTDGSGQATVTFPTNDHALHLRAVVNGLSSDGRVGSAQIESPEKQ